MHKFGSIEQFRNVIHTVKHMTYYAGQEDNGEIIYDETRTLPVINFQGTCKLHGTNAGCYLDDEGNVIPQSRTTVLDEKNDNAGFAKFIKDNEESVRGILELVSGHGDGTPYIFGEWVGKGVQKGCGIHDVDRQWYLFDARLYLEDKERSQNVNLRSPVFQELENIKLIHKYYDVGLHIDFENGVEKAQTTLTEFTEKIEQECPVAKAFGVSGIGEGIVWIGFHPNGQKLSFKTKGDKHKIASTKTKVEIAPEILNSINEFVDYAVTENRVRQACDEQKIEPGNMKEFGKIIRWVNEDINKEESDVLEANGLTTKQVGGFVSRKTKALFCGIVE